MPNVVHFGNSLYPSEPQYPDTTLALSLAASTPGQTETISIPVEDYERLPLADTYGVVDNETFRLISGWTVVGSIAQAQIVRAAEDSDRHGAVAHAAGTPVFFVLTAKALAENPGPMTTDGDMACLGSDLRPARVATTAYGRGVLGWVNQAAAIAALAILTPAAAAAAYMPQAGGTFAGHVLFSADNTYDIGASGATRPRTLYLGTKVVAPYVQFLIGSTASTYMQSTSDGVIQMNNAAGNGFTGLSWYSDLTLYRGGAGIIEQRVTGANPQTHRWFATYTDPSNHLYGQLAASTSAIAISAVGLGTSSATSTDITLTPLNAGRVKIVGSSTNGQFQLEVSSPAANSNGATIYFRTNVGVAEKSGLFSMDNSGNMVFRQSTAGYIYYDYFSGVFFRDSSFAIKASVSTAGKLAIGSHAASAWLDVRNTTEQARFAYDASYYLSITASTGSAAVRAVASDLSLSGDARVMLQSGGGGWSDAYSLSTTASMTYGGGTARFIHGSVTWAPTSGTGDFIGLMLNPVINQTGSSSGSYTGLKVQVGVASAPGTNNATAWFGAGSYPQHIIRPSGATEFYSSAAYSDTLNYARLTITPGTGSATIAFESAGTGAANASIFILPKGTGYVGVGTGGGGSELRFGSSSFQRIATADSGGGMGGGYNFDWNNASPRNDSAGAASGWAMRNNGIVGFYTNASAAAGTTVPLRLMIDTAGNVGINVVPSARWHVEASSGEQARLGYNSGNYLSVTVGSTGATTMALTGTSSDFTISAASGGKIYLTSGEVRVPNFTGVFNANSAAGYYYSTNEIRFRTNSIDDRFTMSSAGNFGIGAAIAANVTHQFTMAVGTGEAQYGAYADGSNYFRLVKTVSTTEAKFAIQSAGTGAVNGDIVLSPLGVGKVKIDNGAGTIRTLLGSPGWDNTYTAWQNATLSESAANSAFWQNSTGATGINAATGQTVSIRVNNTSILTFAATLITAAQAIRANGGLQSSDGSAGLTSTFVGTPASITIKNGLVTAIA